PSLHDALPILKIGAVSPPARPYVNDLSTLTSLLKLNACKPTNGDNTTLGRNAALANFTSCSDPISWNEASLISGRNASICKGAPTSNFSNKGWPKPASVL